MAYRKEDDKSLSNILIDGRRYSSDIQSRSDRLRSGQIQKIVHGHIETGTKENPIYPVELSRYDDLRGLLAASETTPGILLHTSDFPKRTVELMDQVSRSLGRDLYVGRLSRGVMKRGSKDFIYQAPEAQGGNMVSEIQELYKVMILLQNKLPANSVLYLNEFPRNLPEEMIMKIKVAADNLRAKKANISLVVGMSEGEKLGQVFDGYFSEYNLPPLSAAETSAVLLQSFDRKEMHYASGEFYGKRDIPMLTKVLGGLNGMQVGTLIEGAVKLEGGFRKMGSGKDFIEGVREKRRQEILKESKGVIDVIPQKTAPTKLYGIDDVRSYFGTLRDNGDLEAGSLKMPQVVGLIGVPGSGKSSTPDLIAYALKAELLRVKSAGLMGDGTVGSMEQAMGRLFDIVDSLSQMGLTVVHFSEWHEFLEATKSSGHTAGNAHGMAMSIWNQGIDKLQKNHNPVIIFMDMNPPENMDKIKQQFLRTGRYDHWWAYHPIADAGVFREIMVLQIKSLIEEYAKNPNKPEKVMVDRSCVDENTIVDIMKTGEGCLWVPATIKAIVKDSVISSSFIGKDKKRQRLRYITGDSLLQSAYKVRQTKADSEAAAVYIGLAQELPSAVSGRKLDWTEASR
ncbi:MAG TPA: AAA family ATPase, partial [Patescibacteria group bacterium]